MNPTFFDRVFYIAIVVSTAVVFGVVFSVHGGLRTPSENANKKPQDVLPHVSYSDVPPAHRAFEAITELSKQNILQGYPDRTFRPDVTANRAEAIKMLLQISPMERNDVDEVFQKYVRNNMDLPYFLFPDVKTTDWFAPYLYKAYQLGLVGGTPNGNFEAGRPIMLSEFLKMLFVLEREEIAKDDEALSPFEGVDAYMWYTSYFARAKDIGLLPLKEGEDVNPSEQMTRGKIAEVLNAYLQLRINPVKKK